MSSAYAVAVVSEALVMLLQDAINSLNIGGDVVCGHPRNFESGGRKRGINLFLYQVAPNASWRNSEITVRFRPKDPASPEGEAENTQPGAPGKEWKKDKDDRVVRVPIIPLNLYYVVSFYGGESEYQAHRYLSVAMRALHTAAQRLPAHIERVTRAGSGSPAASRPGEPAEEDRFDLTAEEIELFDERIRAVEPVKLTPLQLNLEELSKLWSVFFQVPYTLSVAYEAAVVLLPAAWPRWRPVAVQTTINRPERAEEARTGPGRAEEASADRPAPPRPYPPAELDPWRRGTRLPEEGAGGAARPATPDSPRAGAEGGPAREEAP